MTWTQKTLYSFDCETTGIDVLHDRLVTATVAKIEGGRHVGARSWLIDPGTDIPAQATAVHGITTQHAREHGEQPGDAVADIAGVVAGVLLAGRPLVVFNAAYDLSLLEAELLRHDLPPLSVRVPSARWHTLIDPMVLARGIDKEQRSFAKGRKYRLPDLCERYGVPFVESHDATADAVGAGLLAIAILDAEPLVAGLDPDELFARQQSWRAEDQRSFRAWAARQGTARRFDDIDDGWPLHSTLSDR